MNLFEHIKSILSQNEKYCKDGKLFKNVIVEDALKVEQELLSLLLSDDKAIQHFFTEVGKVLVFDKIKFQKFVSNKQFLPDSYTAYKNKIGLTANGEYLTDAKEVVLSWAYKDCVLEGGQTRDEQKRKEIFWNETLAPDEIDRLFEPKALTNIKRYNEKGESPVKNISLDDNLIIKGNNLLALHSLKKVYKGKIKFIYIDPPYNTGNDSFNYNDSFNHSSWLTFMKNRLEVARDLLTSDGVIFVSCDDNEVAYLKILMDEIFKTDNFIDIFSWKKTDTPSNLPKKSKKVLEYILCYEKNKDSVKYKGVEKQSSSSNGLMNKTNSTGVLTFPKNIVETGLKDGSYKKGKYGTDKYVIELLDDTTVKNGLFTEEVKLQGKFKWGQNKLTNEIERGTIISIRTSSFSPSYEKLEYDIESPINYIDSSMGVQTTENAGKDLTKMFGKEVFSYPKSESLIMYLINMVSNKLSKNDIILDFHLGSGTTCAVAHKLGYKYIGIEQMDYIEDVTVARLNKVISGENTGISDTVEWKGGGSFVYFELAQNNALYLEKIESASTSEVLVNIWDKLKEESFILFKITPSSIDNSQNEFNDLSIENQKQFLISLLDKNELYINACDVNDKSFSTMVSDNDKNITNLFYNLK